MCHKNIFNNINGYPLDEQQIIAATSKSKYSIIIAGAGSGKSTTMIGKVKYLLNIVNVNPAEILCISFTNESTNSLKVNLLKNCNVDICVLTFHKLALQILEDNKINFSIIPTNYLSFVIDEFFRNDNLEIRINTINFLKNRFYTKNYKEYVKLLDSKEFNCFKILIQTFLNIYFAKYSSIDVLLELYKNCKNYKESSFFKLVIAIYYLYETEKKSQNLIDFDDMIKLATNTINSNGKVKNYKYIIIDEFQDTSLSRFNLIQAIINRNNSNLTVVGDDFQSIYRFSGCSIDLFLNFKERFKEAEVLKIENTYRNSQELINIAGDFVMKNKFQISKDLKSSKHLEKPLKIIYEKNNTLINLIKNLANENFKTILILGRNNFDIKNYLSKDLTIDKDGNIFIKDITNLHIKYLTVHKSKGLEADICIIINLINSKYGFPNKIKDHHILNYLNDNDKFPYEEERRLFYVAITRTKNYVFLLTEKNNTSTFVKELIHNYKHLIDYDYKI